MEGMRDLERLEEARDGTSRRLLTLLLAALATVGLVLAMGMVLGAGGSAEAAEADDSLAALDLLSESDAQSDDEATPQTPFDVPEVDREELAFPEALGGYDRRPEVEAALAAATAELEHPDPIPSGVALGDVLAGAEGPEPMPVDDSVPTSLPAADAIGRAPEVLAAGRESDPMVAAALPTDEEPAPPAPPGHDGELTVQVVSYQNPHDAEVFAEGLRARGHRAFVTTAEIPDRGRFWRVRIGPFETPREAEQYRRDFEAAERMNTIVVRQRTEPSDELAD